MADLRIINKKNVGLFLILILGILSISGCVSQQAPLTLRPEVLESKEIPLSTSQFVACENYA
ncbi:hypothetical protein HYT51_01390, partial [Candidatus Woesearchaeota archaeon]|nr:hypothetical protein [Candidatus Woesearchaeota archaeon]